MCNGDNGSNDGAFSLTITSKGYGDCLIKFIHCLHRV